MTDQIIRPGAYLQVRSFIKDRPSVQASMVKGDTTALTEYLNTYAVLPGVSQEQVVAFAHVVGLKTRAEELAFTHGMKLQVEALANDSWWNSLNRDQQQQYIEMHPTSKYAHEQLNQQQQPAQPQVQPAPVQQPAPAPAVQPQAPQPAQPQPPAQQPAPVEQPPQQPAPAQQPAVAPVPPVQQPQPTPVDPNQQPAQPAPVQPVPAPAVPAVAPTPAPAPAQPQPAPAQPQAQQPVAPAQDQVPGKPKLSERLAQSLKKMPSTAAKFFHDGGTAPGSNERRTAAQHVRDKSKAFAKHLVHQGKEVKDGVHAIGKLVHTRSWSGLSDHDRHAIKALGVEAGMLVGGIAVSGGLAHLVHAPAMIALKHLGGHWAAEAAMKAAGHAVLHASTETAGLDEQKVLTQFINALADMLESGDIPEDAWDKTADDIVGSGSEMHTPPTDAVNPHPCVKTITDKVTDTDRPGVSSEDLEDGEDPEIEEAPTESVGDDRPDADSDEDIEEAPTDDEQRDQADDGKDVSSGPSAEKKDDATNPDAKAPESDAAPSDEPTSKNTESEPEDDVEEIPVENEDSGDDSENDQIDEKEVVEDGAEPSQPPATTEDSSDEDDIVEEPTEDEEDEEDGEKKEKEESAATEPSRNVQKMVKYETVQSLKLKIEQFTETLQKLKKEGPSQLIPGVQNDLADAKEALKLKSKETSRIKGADDYTWLRYTGKPVILNFRGTRFTLTNGMEFGVRLSSNKKDKRLVVDHPDMGLTKVITLTPELENHLRTRVEKASGSTLSFRDSLTRQKKVYTEVTLHGRDGLGASVYSAMSPMGWPSVLVVLDNKLIASSVNDGSCKTLTDAKEKAQYQVDKATTRYWDSKQPMERFYNASSRPDSVTAFSAPDELLKEERDLKRARRLYSTKAAASIKVTFTLRDLTDVFYEGTGDDRIKGLNNMDDAEKFAYLSKKSKEGTLSIKMKIASGQFKDAVALNSLIRSPCNYKFKLEPRVGYKLATFEVSPK